MTTQTIAPDSIRALVTPMSKTADKKVRTFALHGTWIPFFKATNLQGVTALPEAVIGAPERYARSKDGVIKFGANGRPSRRLDKDLKTQVDIVMSNFEVNTLRAYAATVQADNEEKWADQDASIELAAEPVLAKESADYVAEMQRIADEKAAEMDGASAQTRVPALRVA